jgi:hypothetical protein
MRMTSKNIRTSLSKLPTQKCLTLLNKHFKEDILHTELFVNILKEYLLEPIISTWLP